MLGTVGNRDSTVVGGVDKEVLEEEKLLEKIPGKIPEIFLDKNW